MSYISLNLSGGFGIETTNFDNVYIVSLTPRFHKYLSGKVEIIADYTVILHKLSNAEGRKKNLYNQFSSSARFFPLKKLNIFYLESGVQVGNYARTLDSNGQGIAQKNWHSDLLVGLGIELLPKQRKRILDFEVRFALPLDNSLRPDFARLIGFGTRVYF